MLGLNTGEQYESEFDHLVASYHGSTRPVGASEKPMGALKKDQGRVPTGEPQIPTWLPGQFKDQAPLPNQFNKPQSIDRTHHVPLVASALTDSDGQMYGMAIDHRIPAKPEYEKHLWKHEAYENDYMNDLVKTGMSSQDAYHKAHDWSTARESAAVTAEFGEKGLEDYKQHWRDASAIAAEPTDRERHPDAHTTKHGLDESELGQKYAMNEKRPILTPDPTTTYHGGGTNPLHGGGGKLPESIYSPAVKMGESGKVHMGDHHGEAFRNAVKEEGKPKYYSEDYEGFMTSKGRFVDRKEALKIAREAKQIEEGRDYEGKKELLSEDLIDSPASAGRENIIKVLRDAFK
jgi:hypothetical protein